MPLYDYLCPYCGAFEALQPMAASEKPTDCPACGASAPRVILNAPRLATMDQARRTAFATNERSSHAPRNLSSPANHGANCGCCTPRKGDTGIRDAKTAKSFSGKRPWMISH